MTLGELAALPSYPRVLAAATIARAGNEMSAVTVVLLVLERTGSASLAGLTLAALTFPSLLSGPLLGAWLDAGGRRIGPLALDQAVTVTSLLALAVAPEWALPLVALPAGVLLPLSAGGFTSLLPSLVPVPLLARANAVEAASFNGALVAGPALAAVVIALASPLAALLAQVALKLLALLLVARLSDPRAGRRSGVSLPRTAAAGLSIVVSSPPLLAVTVASALAIAARGLLTLAFPLLAVERLDGGPHLAGWLWAAYAAGSVAGALLTPGLQRRMAPVWLALGSLALTGVLLAPVALAASVPVALALVAVAGAAYGPGFAAQFGVRQQAAPDALHGTVFMTAVSSKIGSLAIGAALAAPVVAAVGPEGALLACGAGHVAAALAGVALYGRPSSSAKRAGSGSSGSASHGPQA